MIKVSSEDSLQVETTITKHFGWKFHILSNSNRESRENSSEEILLLAELFHIQCFNITKQVAQFLWDKLTSFPRYESWDPQSSLFPIYASEQKEYLWNIYNIYKYSIIFMEHFPQENVFKSN